MVIGRGSHGKLTEGEIQTARQVREADESLRKGSNLNTPEVTSQPSAVS